MNIICNNCIGSRLYRINNVEYNNPFIWASTPFSDYIKVVHNYDNINFNNFDIQFDDCKRTNNMSPVVICDNLFKVHFIHYIEDKNAETPIHKVSKGNVDVFYKDIIHFTSKKWNNRVCRMLNNPTPPVFLYTFNWRYKSYNEMLNASDTDLQQYDNMLQRLYNESLNNKKIIVLMHNNKLYEKYKRLEHKYFYIITVDINLMIEDKEPLWNNINRQIKNILH